MLCAMRAVQSDHILTWSPSGQNLLAALSVLDHNEANSAEVLIIKQRRLSATTGKTDTCGCSFQQTRQSLVYCCLHWLKTTAHLVFANGNHAQSVYLIRSQVVTRNAQEELTYLELSTCDQITHNTLLLV